MLGCGMGDVVWGILLRCVGNTPNGGKPMLKNKFEFEKLEVYQRSIEFYLEINRLTQNFPKVEKFGLVSQIRRAAHSVPSNIAEGYGRYHTKDKIKYYRIARSSVYECIPTIKISYILKYIDLENHDKLYNECLILSKMISGLIRSISRGYTK
jgi:four helix bundle protein